MSTMSPLPGIDDYNALWDYYNENFKANSAFCDQANQITMVFQYNGGPDSQGMANAVRSVASMIRRDGSWKGEAADSCCNVLDQLAANIDKEYEQYCSWVQQVIQYYKETMRKQEQTLESYRKQFDEEDEKIYQQNLNAGRYLLGN